MRKRDCVITTYRARSGASWVFEARVFRVAGVGTRLGLFRELQGNVAAQAIGARVLEMLREAKLIDQEKPHVGGRPVDEESAAVLGRWRELTQMNQPSRALRRFSICEVLERPGQTSWLVQQVVQSKHAGCTTWAEKRRIKHATGAEGLGAALTALTEGKQTAAPDNPNQGRSGRRTTG